MQRSNRPIITVRGKQIHPLPPPQPLGHVARLQAARDEEDRVIALFLGGIKGELDLALQISGLANRFMKERVFAPLGVENVNWDRQGGGGKIGPHTNAHSGLHIAARDFARVGYMLAHGGNWESKEIVPKWWIDLATRSSQQILPTYGYTFWVNTSGEFMAVSAP